MERNELDVAVLGAGITGLTAAWSLVRSNPALRVRVLESSNKVGGVLDTVDRDGFLIERCADNFLAVEPDAVQLAEDLGLKEELIGVSPQAQRALILRGQSLLPVPAGLQIMAPARWWPLLTTPLMSWPGRLRLAMEPFVPTRKSEDEESLGEFARRRLGREAFDRLVQPLAGGIYTADPDKLSMKAVLPRFIQMEREHGSLFWGMRAKAKTEATASATRGARYAHFLTFKRGMRELTQTLAQRIGHERIQLNTMATNVRPMDSRGWNIDCGDGAWVQTKSVIVALPAPAASGMVRAWNTALADLLTTIPYDGSAVAVLAYKKNAMKSQVQASGFVVPHLEGRRILAASFSSNKFPNRAPQDSCLIRVFLGGALQRDLLQNTSDELAAIAHQELRDILQISGEPLFCEVVRWDRAMPQYHIGHLDRVAAITKAASEYPGLAFAGAAYHGVGIPHCIRDGKRAAAQSAEYLKRINK